VIERKTEAAKDQDGGRPDRDPLDAKATSPSASFFEEELSILVVRCGRLLEQHRHWRILIMKAPQ
jgi:hypothetical protein